MQRRSLAAALLAFALVAPACGSKDDKTTVAPTSTISIQPGGTFATTPPADSGSAGSPGPTNAAGEPVTTIPGGSATPAKPAQGATATTATTAKAPPAVSNQAYPFAKPGAYTVVVSGKSTVTGFGDQDLGGEGTITVSPPTGADQKRSEQTKNGTNEQVGRYTRDGIGLVSLSQTQSGISKTFVLDPPGTLLPANVGPGKTWSWKATSTDGKTNVDSSFAFSRKEPITIGGKPVDATVIEATVKLSGDITSTSKQTIWISVADGLIVQQKDVTDGTYGAAKFHSESTRTLKSTSPH